MRGLPPLVIPAVLIRSILVVGAFQASAIVTLILSPLFPATFLGRGDCVLRIRGGDGCRRLALSLPLKLGRLTYSVDRQAAER